MTAGDPTTVTVEESDAEHDLPPVAGRPPRGAPRRRGSPTPRGRSTWPPAPRDGRLVGVVRFSPAPCPWREARAPWQLRGMATDPAVRGTGAGRALVAEGLARVAALGGDLVWCDARLAAVGFYERMGFTVVTEQFDKPEGGPHLGMLVVLRAGRRDLAAALSPGHPVSRSCGMGHTSG